MMGIVWAAMGMGWGANAFSQNLAIEKFSGDRALPSEELYDIEEDDFGNKWVASDVGLIKITGTKVRHYTRKDGLYEDVILDLIRGPHNIIWATGLKGSISMVRNDSILPMPVNDALSPLFENQYTYDEAVDAQGNLYLSYSKYPVVVLLAETGYRTFKTFGSDGPCNFLVDGQMLRKAPCENLDIAHRGKPVRVDVPADYTVVGHWNSDCVDREDSTVYISSVKKLVEIKNMALSRCLTFDEVVLSTQKIDDKLYIGKRYSGYCYMHDNGEPVCEKNILSDKSVTRIIKDREGNFWFATLEKGLYICRSPKFVNIYEGETHVLTLVPKGKKVGVLLSDQKLSFSPGTFEELKVPHPNKASVRVADVLYHPNNAGTFSEYVITPYDMLRRNGNGYERLVDRMFFFRKMRLLSDNAGFIVFGNNGILAVENGEIRWRYIPDNVMDMAIVNDSLIWLGTLATGIWKLYRSDNGWTCRQWGPKYRINSLALTENKIVAVGTNDYGVLPLNLEGALLGRIKNTPTRIQSLQYNDKRLYIGTKEGLYVHNFATHNNRFFNSTNLLPFDEVVELKIQDTLLYMAGKYQALKIRLEDLKTLEPRINIRIREVRVNDVELSPTNLDSLTHDQNYFLFTVENSSFRGAKNLSVRYSVFGEGKHISTHDTRENYFNLYLKPGRYDIRIQAVDLATGTESNVVYAHVYIRPAFYQTGWFLVLVIFISALLLGLLFYAAIKTIKAREQRKRKIMEKMHALENVALQNQMNPHFIFNAINSIQDYVLSNRRETAHHYLAEFAKLVRLTLNNNRQQMVALNEELKLLGIYISLEEQRIKDKIDLRVTMDERIDPDEVLIPSLLLQPLVENAIWHGLAGTGREKWIAITFEVEGEHLIISVRDNGHGLSAADGAHQSHGLNIIRERIKLLYKKEPDFTYYHMQNNDEHSGVTVKLILPLLADIWE